MATGTFPSHPTPPPVQPVPAPPTGYERSVEEQLRRTRVQVKVVEIVSNSLMLIVGSLGYLLLLAVVDHWVLSLGFWTRLLALAVLLGGAGWWFAVRILPLMVRRINPVYAAYTIEQAEPSLKNSLINFLLLRSHRGQVHDAVYHALGQRAASDLSQAPADNAVDHSHLIRLGYVLAGLLALGLAYKILSPKDPLQSVARVMAPWADIEKPSRVDIADVRPLDVSVFQGEQIEVSASVSGIRSRDEVRVIFSTLDGQVVEAPLIMELDTTTSRHTATLPGDDRGVQSSLQYKILAGDAETRWYNVEVLPAPHVLVTKVLYEPPKYMGREKEETSRGDIAGTEGTKVTIFARANRDVESAHLEFDPVIQPDGRAAASGGGGNSVNVRKIKGADVEVSFYLQLQDDRKTPWHSSYCLTFTGKDGHRNRQPVVQIIDVKPDLAPLVEILTPVERKVQIPLNGKAEIEVRAIDHDFALSQLRLVGIRDGEDVLNELLLNSAEGRVGQVIQKFEFKPAKYDLKVGDVIEYWAVAADNRTAVQTESPQPNVTRSRPNYEIEIIAAEDREGKSPDDKGDGGDMNDEAEAGDDGASDGSSASQAGNSGEGSDKAENKKENSSEQNSDAGGQSGNAGGSSASQSDQGGNQKSESKDGSSDGADSQQGGSSQRGEGGDDGQSEKSSDGASGNENSAGSESSEGGGEQQGGQGQKSGQGQQGGQPSQSSEPVANDGSQDGDVFDRVEKFRQQQEKMKQQAGNNAQQSPEQNAGDAQSGQGEQQEGQQSGGDSGGNQQGQKPQQGQSAGEQGGGAQGSQEPQSGASGQKQGAGQSGGQQQDKPKDGSSGSQQENSGGGSEQGEQEPPAGGSDSQGGQPQGGQKPKDQRQQAGGEGGQQPMGGGQGDNDKSGAGEKSDGGGSPQSQAEKPEQKGQQQSGGGKQGGGQKQEDGGKSPSGSNKGSQSQGESGGDRKGGGQQGGGQGAQKPGQDQRRQRFFRRTGRWRGEPARQRPVRQQRRRRSSRRQPHRTQRRANRRRLKHRRFQRRAARRRFAAGRITSERSIHLRRTLRHRHAVGRHAQFRRPDRPAQRHARPRNRPPHRRRQAPSRAAE